MPRVRPCLARRPRETRVSTPHTETIAQAVTAAHCPNPQYANCAVVLCRVTFPPGSSTGWHFHPGTLIALVEQGELHHQGPTGELRTYHAGDAVIEPSGPDYVHCGANGRSGQPTRLLALYITPKGKPLTIPATAPTARDSTAEDQPG